jgi:hypothetical protein
MARTVDTPAMVSALSDALRPRIETIAPENTVGIANYFSLIPF